MNRSMPTPAQLAFMDWEMGAFFHFGIRTFYEGHRDWDGRPMPAAGFLPEQLDCAQWIRAIKGAGMTYAILTCKHHDGFANWPTRTSSYSVAASSWRSGQGDVVRDFTEACRAYGIKIGLYYSPADAAMKKGERTAREHDDFFVSQITELLSDYGKIDYLWFDGNGSEGHVFDSARIVSVMRGLQPDLLIFGQWDHDVRWIGNEEGFAPPDFQYLSTYPAGDSHFPHLSGPVTRFLPAECDFRLRERNWFYSDCDGHTIKSVPELMGIYDYSVGRSCNFLMNIAPDRRGLLPGADCERLAEFGQTLRNRFARPLPAAWREQEQTASLTLAVPSTVKTLVLEEDLTAGQAITGFQLSFAPGHIQHDLSVAVCTGQTIGHKRIIELPALFARRFDLQLTVSQAKTRYLKQVTAYQVLPYHPG